MENGNIWTLIAKKLSGEASETDLKELELELRNNPELHYSLEALNDLWNTNRESPKENPNEIFEKHLDRMRMHGFEMKDNRSDTQKENSTFKHPIDKFKKPAIALLVLTILFFTFNFFNTKKLNLTIPKAQHEVVTQNGTKTNLLLPDGTSVWLNAGSRLTYDSLYGSSSREVTLSGEAFFDVVKNAKKPFIIHTGKIKIKVLGTVFNVKSYPGEKTIETSLIKGSIEVSFPSISSKKIILKDNQKLIINKSETILPSAPAQNQSSTNPNYSIKYLYKQGSDSVITETGWMQNRLFFDDISFNDLLKVMERKYGVTFKLADSGLDKIHFTGSFQNETVTQALDALRLTAEKSTSDFTFQLEGNQVIIYNNSGVHSN